MSQKINILTNNTDADKQIYIIFFIHVQSKTIVFLAYNADIEAICYDSNPSLSGTNNYKLAKQYESIEEAKNDIYKLRYHHREFLKVITGIKGVDMSELDSNNQIDIKTNIYQLTDLA